MKRWHYALLAAAGLGAAAAGVRLGRHASAPGASISSASKAASADSGATQPPEPMALALPDLQGKTQPLSQWRGKLLVVNFWASWCPPCREEMPGFSRLQQQFAGKGVQFVGIAMDTPDNVQKFVQTLPVSYPLLVGSADMMSLLENYGDAGAGLPFTLVIDRDGMARKRRLGKWDEADLSAALTALLAEPGAGRIK